MPLAFRGIIPAWGSERRCMDVTLKGIVRYDGTGLAGWQVQPEQRTVQGDIEAALSRIASRPVRIHGASRTDAGVHALGQTFSFAWPECLPHDGLRRSLAAMLAPAIRVESVEPAPPGFHARKSAKGKRYAYALNLDREPDPFSARYAWCIPWSLDPEQIHDLAQDIVGEHDFAGYRCSGSDVETTVRSLYSVEVRRGGVVGPLDASGLWRIEFHGDGFLYKMVRNITGVLVDVARGRLAATRLAEGLRSSGPFQGHTAPAHGLTLVEVLY